MGIEAVGTSRPFLVAVAYAMGRTAGRIRPVVTSTAGASAEASSASAIGPLAGGAAIGALWGSVHGYLNLKRYRKREISGGEALRNTASETVGFGVATATGIAVANVVRATTLMGSSVALVPFVVATAATSGAKVLWDRLAQEMPQSRPGGRLVTEVTAHTDF